MLSLSLARLLSYLPVRDMPLAARSGSWAYRS
eukprot:COSAG06_NODE_46039_length_350_cov_0.605578_1_plen_32_part_10